MEDLVFPRPAVAGALEGYVEARLHLDSKDSARNERYTEMQVAMVDSVARPTYVLYDPKAMRILAAHQGWMPGGKGAEFAAFLSSVRRVEAK